MLKKLQYFAISSGFVLILAFCSMHGVFAGGFSGAPLQLPIKIDQGGTSAINGPNALRNLGSVSYQTDWGCPGVLIANTTGGANVGGGCSALSSNTTGAFNVAYGENALRNVVAGSNNSAFGTAALTNNTASNNSAFGYQALAANTTGTENSAFGYLSLNSTTGSGNSAFGFSAAQASSTGTRISAFGYDALALNTGSENTAFGWNALGANTTGTHNQAFGYNAGSLLTTGNNNVIVGSYPGVAGMVDNVILSDGGGTIVLQYDGGTGNTSLPNSVNLSVGGLDVLTHSDITTGAAGVAITAGASPFAYTATFAGSVAISAGTVSAVTLTRAAVVVWSVTASNEIIPVRAGDVVTVTYTVAPTMYQLTD